MRVPAVLSACTIRRRGSRIRQGRPPWAALTLAALLLLPPAGCGPEPAGEEPLRTGLQTAGGAVAAPTAASAEAAISVLERGGNAADAAFAAAFAAMVTRPLVAGLGARATVLAVPAGGEGGDSALTLAGAPDPSPRPGAPSPPTGVSVLFELLDRYGSGRLDRRELLAPALELASTGAQIGRDRHRLLILLQPVLSAGELLTNLFLESDGTIAAEGSVRPSPALAATLEVLAEEGPDGFYRGEHSPAIGAAAGFGAGWLWLGEEARPEPPAVVAAGGPTYVLIERERGEGRRFLRTLSFLEAADARSDPVSSDSIWPRAAAAALVRAGAPGPAPPAAFERDSFRVAFGPPDTTGAGTPAPRGRGPAPVRVEPGPGGSLSVDPERALRTVALAVVDGGGLVVLVGLSLGEALGSKIAAPEAGFVLASDRAEAALTSAFVGVVVQDGDTGTRLAATATGEGAAGGSLAQLLRSSALPGGPDRALTTPRIATSPDPVARLYFEGARQAEGESPATAYWGVQPEGAAAALGHPLGALGPAWVGGDGLSPFFGSVSLLLGAGTGWTAASDPRTEGSAQALPPGGGG